MSQYQMCTGQWVPTCQDWSLDWLGSRASSLESRLVGTCWSADLEEGQPKRVLPVNITEAAGPNRRV